MRVEWKDRRDRMRRARREIDGDTLIEGLADPDPRVRAYAMMFLGQIRESTAVEPVLAFLSEQDQSVRVRALKALRDIGDARAVPPLVGLAHDRSESLAIRCTAADALVAIDTEAAVAALAGIVECHKRSYRRWAVGQLVGVADPRALPMLERVAARGDVLERRRARRAIRAIKARRSKPPPRPLPIGADVELRDLVGEDGKEALSRELLLYDRYLKPGERALILACATTRRLTPSLLILTDRRLVFVRLPVLLRQIPRMDSVGYAEIRRVEMSEWTGRVKLQTRNGTIKFGVLGAPGPIVDEIERLSSLASS